mmetsp:Transcript_15757/g.28340  ORF Transcript_15757/g.28340 Transcript_15757/m.28340 type:complete len:222 (-) Transcript_15757:17-682(-)
MAEAGGGLRQHLVHGWLVGDWSHLYRGWRDGRRLQRGGGGVVVVRVGGGGVFVHRVVVGTRLPAKFADPPHVPDDDAQLSTGPACRTELVQRRVHLVGMGKGTEPFHTTELPNLETRAMDVMPVLSQPCFPVLVRSECLVRRAPQFDGHVDHLVERRWVAALVYLLGHPFLAGWCERGPHLHLAPDETQEALLCASTSAAPRVVAITSANSVHTRRRPTWG